jgi:hypothetical protein
MEQYTVYYKVTGGPQERWALTTAATKDDAQASIQGLLEGKGTVTRVVPGWKEAQPLCK